MQTTLPTTQPTTTAADYLSTLPQWEQLVVGFLLIGVVASILSTRLRAAIPPPVDPRARSLHYLYPPLFGGAIGAAIPDALPHFEVGYRLLLGVAAPFLWAYVYEIYRARYEKTIGVTLPTSAAIVRGDTPTTAPTPPQTEPV